MKKIFFILPILVMCVWLSAQTSFTATYTFSGSSGNTSNFAYNGIIYDGIQMGNMVKNGITSTSKTDCFRGNNWPYPPNANLDTNKYIGFTITAAPGYKFTVQTINFGIGRSATGPRDTEWRGSADSYASTINNYTSINQSLVNNNGVLNCPDLDSGWTGNELTLGSDYVDITSSCGFRMYMYNSEAQTGTGGLQGPITITGTFEQIEAVPMISLNPSTLSGFTMEKNKPSESKNYILSGTNLTSDILITPPSGYQLSQDNINWVSSLSLAPDFN